MQGFEQLDTNHDGVIDRAEWAAMLAQHGFGGGGGRAAPGPQGSQPGAQQQKAQQGAQEVQQEVQHRSQRDYSVRFYAPAAVTEVGARHVSPGYGMQETGGQERWGGQERAGMGSTHRARIASQPVEWRPAPGHAGGPCWPPPPGPHPLPPAAPVPHPLPPAPMLGCSPL